ncbi:MAG: VCBS repeat-containing protein [Planctomycetota bacterium]
MLRFSSLVAGALLLTGVAQAQTIVVTVPPPGTQTAGSSVDVEGFLVGTPGPQTVFEVFFRTRYPSGDNNPPINREGWYEPGVLGWGYDVVNWDPVTGLGEFSGRMKWFDQGTNHLDFYLPTDTLGSPNYTQTITYQSSSVTPTDVVAGIHPSQRTIDVTDVDGNVGEIKFLVDMINTSPSAIQSVDLTATMRLPDQTTVDLPMGGPGQNVQQYVIPTGDFTFTSTLDPAGMTFTFPLDQAPFPGVIQTGEYHMEVRVFDTATQGLIYLDEDVDFWVTDRVGKDFRDVTDQAGLGDIVLQGGSLPSAGNSILVFDYNSDGLTDLFFTNPAGEQTFLAIGDDIDFPGGRNYLMRNNGDGTFADVTAAAGVEGDLTKAAYGGTWADADIDGDLDMFVVNRGARPYMYMNNDDGTFTDVALGSFTGITGWWMNPRFGDIDADGDYDLFVGRYLKTFDTTWISEAWTDRIYRNEMVEGIMDPFEPTFPAFTFTGGAPAGMALATFFADFNRDGNLDVAVHNDFGHFVLNNTLLEGDGAFGFTDVSVTSGYGVREFSMGSGAGDFDNDGNLDVYSSNIGRNSLLFGNGDGTFVQGINGSGAEGIYLVDGPQADGVNLDDNWGVFVFDYDKDADTDLYVIGSDLFTGFNLPIAEVHPDSFYVNDGTGNFTNQAAALGLANAARGRGGAVLDYDNDGDLDVIISNENEGVTLSRNDHVTSNHHIAVRPIARRSAPGAFNTFFEVTAGGQTQVHEIMAGCAHGTQQDNDYWFGVAGNTSGSITAHWPRGGSTTIFNAPVDVETQVHEMVLAINDGINVSAAVGTQPTARMHGEPGDLVVGAIANPVVPGPFPLPGGGTLDIFPLINLITIAFLDANGEAPYGLPLLDASLSGITFQFQMTNYDIFTGTVPAKSGVSSLTVTP